MTRIIFFGLVFSLLTSIGAFGQKLKADNWEISIVKWEVETVDMFGSTQTIYLGLLKVKQGKKKYGNYRFYFPKIKGKLIHLAIRDMNDELIEPRLYYNEENKSFTYNQGTDQESTEVTIQNADTKDLVLSGMLIWLNQKE